MKEGLLLPFTGGPLGTLRGPIHLFYFLSPGVGGTWLVLSVWNFPSWLVLLGLGLDLSVLACWAVFTKSQERFAVPVNDAHSGAGRGAGVQTLDW